MLSKINSSEAHNGNGYHSSNGLSNGVSLAKRSPADVSCLSGDQKKALPDPEPSTPPKGFKFRVSRPFIADNAKENVVNYISRGLISSATEPVKEFEGELVKFYGVGWAKACSSGYSALVLALKNADIGCGDEVIIPSLTMVAVATAVYEVGAKPVFVDCALSKDGVPLLNPSAEQYRSASTPSTAAIIATHTYGVPANCVALRQLCKELGIVFIEDIAEAIGTKCEGRYVGTYGHYATASLYANKVITSGDGGFVLAADTSVDKRTSVDADTNHGFTPGHHFVHWRFSGNFKMCGLAAAFVAPAVKEIPRVMRDRERISAEYRKHLAGVEGLTLMESNPHGTDAPWVFGATVQAKEIRTAVRGKMAADGIETRDYFFPLHLQPCVVNEFGPQPSLPNSELLGRTGFYLPTYCGLSAKDIAYISSSLKSALSSVLQVQ